MYTAENALTLTGAKADHRLALHPRSISNIAVAVANQLGAQFPKPALPEEALHFAEAAAKALVAAHGQALVLAGPTQSSEVQAVVDWINYQLNAPTDFIEPIDQPKGREPSSLADLANDLDGGSVKLLLILNANPAYDAPADLRMGNLLRRATSSIHLGSHLDETAMSCQWHVPLSHALESWSDLRARDGTASIIQPLILPLYASRTAHELLATIMGQPNALSYDLVRETWQPIGGADFETWWRKVLHDGIIAQTTSVPATVAAPQLPPSRRLTSRKECHWCCVPIHASGTGAGPIALAARMPKAVQQGGLGSFSDDSARRCGTASHRVWRRHSDHH